MRCHHIKADINGTVEKVLIPGCMGTAVYNDIGYCTCPKRVRATYKELQAEIKALKARITVLETKNT